MGQGLEVIHTFYTAAPEPSGYWPNLSRNTKPHGHRGVPLLQCRHQAFLELPEKCCEGFHKTGHIH